MIHDNENFEQASEPANSFTVRGQTVTLLSPMFARITIQCPFPRTTKPTLQEKQFVMNETQSVVNYMIQEGMISPTGGIGIMVLTTHPETL